MKDGMQLNKQADRIRRLYFIIENMYTVDSRAYSLLNRRYTNVMVAISKRLIKLPGYGNN